MEWRYSEILSSYSQFCSRESQKSKNSERDEDEFEYKTATLQFDMVVVEILSEVSMLLKAEEVYCTSPQRCWWTRQSSKKEWLHAKECHKPLSPFILLWSPIFFWCRCFIPSLSFLTSNFFGNTFPGRKETKFSGKKPLMAGYQLTKIVMGTGLSYNTLQALSKLKNKVLPKFSIQYQALTQQSIQRKVKTFSRER